MNKDIYMDRRRCVACQLSCFTFTSWI